MESLTEIRARMPKEETLISVSELFGMFGDTTRVKILCALQLRELCVGELAELLQMQQSAVSHQLRLLKAARLVRGRKQGREVRYALDDEHVGAIFALAFTHVAEGRKY